MSLGNIAYLVLVVGGFSTFAVVLFSAWAWTNWSIRVPDRAAKQPHRIDPDPKRAPYAKAA
jgi:hypothetical protein